MNDVPTNAIAGPSSPRRIPIAVASPSQMPPAPGLFFPPPAQPQPKTYLASTQDLLSRFNLLPAYDTYVRPFAATSENGLGQPQPATPNPTVSGGIDKGKAREVLGHGVGGGQAGAGSMAGDRGDADDDDGPGGKAGKKKKNSYKNLIKGMPGKHSMKKDDYLATIIQVPPKQRIRIAPFDTRTQREAFTVSSEGLKGWNPGNLIAESPQAKENRKKQREAKRLHTLQPQETLVSPTSNGAPSQISIQAPIPTPASGPSTNERPPGTSTPQPNPVGTTKPGSSVPRPGSAVPRPGSAVARPGSIAPGSIPINTVRSASGPVKPSVVPQPSPQLPTSVSTPIVANANGPSNPLTGPRGVKRDRDESAIAVNGTGVNGTAMIGNGAANGTAVPMQGSAHATVHKTVVNARAGMPGVRPRPVKKQRLDVQGRDVAAPVQQPTPQGV